VAPRYELAVLRLEAAQRAGGRLAARARRSRRSALRVAEKVAARRPEILRLAGSEAWLRGRYGRALRSYTEALRVGRHLGARPELARTCAEVARRLAADRGPDRLEGRDAAAWREEASGLRAGLGLDPEAPMFGDPPA
jgi:hypothetical protein